MYRVLFIYAVLCLLNLAFAFASGPSSTTLQSTGQLTSYRQTTQSTLTAQLPQTAQSVIFVQNPTAGLNKPNYLSFKDWKHNKIQEVHNRIDGLKLKIDARRLELEAKKIELADKKTSSAGVKADINNTKDSILQYLESQVKLCSYSLEAAADLTVSDYFAAYVNRLENKKESFKEIAQKLTPDEMAELMTAYSRSLSVSSFPAQAEDLSEEKTK